MIKSREVVKRVTGMVLDGRLSRREAAQLLESNERTIYNYVKKYLSEGPVGLIDHRRGHFRKIQPEQELKVLVYKLDNPRRSARWIRDRLKLPVSVEAVRQILFRHGLSRCVVEPGSRFGAGLNKWDPF